MSPPPIKTRVRLARGESGGREWVPNDDVPGARVDVGSDARASWRIIAPGVQAHHFQLYWDGIQLWAADLHAVGDLRHNGNPFRDWEPLVNGSTLEFGKAALQVRGPSTQSIDQMRQDEEEDPVSVPNALALGTLPGAPTKVAADPKMKALNTQLVGLPEHRPSAVSVPAPRPVAGAGVERVDRSSEIALDPVSNERARPRFQQPPPIGDANSETRGPLGQPMRTWILVGALLVGVVCVLFMEGEQPASPMTDADAGASAAPPIINPYRAVIRPHHIASPDDENPVEDAPTPAREAADALISGREWEAADLYAGLTAAHPETEAYTIILESLRRRLQLRCDADPDQEGERCAR